jgi:hypothetical protein
MVILSVGWSKRMNNLARMALLVYCAVLTIMPLSNLHVEDLLSNTNLLADLVHQKTDLLVLIHEVLFAHFRNLTDHLYRPVDRICGHLIDQTSEWHVADGMALRPSFFSLGLLASAFYSVRRYSLRKSKTQPHTIFCYRLFEHSPPILYSL